VPVRNLVKAPPPAEDGAASESAAAGATGFYAPGSVIRLGVDTASPLAFGMPAEVYAMTTGGSAFDSEGAGIRTVAHFAKDKLLASGFASGEKAVLGKSALVEARVGQGRVILFGFRPQYRAQTWATFKLLFNALYYATMEHAPATP
jgi:hypothetical protein